MSGWVASLPCTRADADRLSEGADLPDPAPVLAMAEEDEAADRWRLDGYWAERPSGAALEALARLLPDADVPVVRRVEERDWVVESQAGLEPVVAGRFVVVTDEGTATPPGPSRLVVPATNAFGTGHHETTAGCLAMLDRLQRTGRRFGRIADIGTGTGLLAFAAQRLWPTARIVVSDIDPAALGVAGELAERNGVPLGRGPGRLTLVTAPGTDHPLIERGTPYDLVIANILAGPLIALMPAFARLLAEGATLMLAGLTEDQQGRVVLEARRCGLRLVEAPRRGRWPTLRLVKRPSTGRRSPAPSRNRTGEFGEW